jgi:VanZ family protein
MLNKLMSAAAWACLVFIAFATPVPLHSRPALTGTEPFSIVLLERVVAFAVLGLLFSISHPRRYRFIFVVVFGSAIVLEVLQIFVPDRDARVLDAIEKLVGGGIGISGGCWLLSDMPARVAALVWPSSQSRL